MLLFLTINSFLFFNFEFDLRDFIFEEYIKKIDRIIDEQAEFEKNWMDLRIKVDTDICRKISEIFLYNLDSRGLRTILLPYMELPEIQAIRIVDYKDQPFLALWKAGGIKTGEAIPEHIDFNEQ